VVTFYAVFLNLSAFINPVRCLILLDNEVPNRCVGTDLIQFFIASWQETSGWTWTFTTQGLVVLAGGCAVFGVLHKFGAWMRAKAPQPSWANPEFDMDP
jgi:hypothetical protein